MSSFDDLQERVFALYTEKRFEEIRGLLDGAVEHLGHIFDAFSVLRAFVNGRQVLRGGNFSRSGLKFGRPGAAASSIRGSQRRNSGHISQLLAEGGDFMP
jgi:hypothetical protein